MFNNTPTYVLKDIAITTCKIETDVGGRGMAPLHIAACNGNKELFQFLFQGILQTQKKYLQITWQADLNVAFDHQSMTKLNKFVNNLRI